MNRRRIHRCFFWLLPLLVARALVPVGSMLAAEAGGLRMALCPSQSGALLALLAAGAPQFDSAAAAHHHHHGHGGSVPAVDAQTDSSSDTAATCPYALAGALAAVDTTPLQGAFTAVSEPSLTTTRLPIPDSPQRAHPIRGPPLLS